MKNIYLIMLIIGSCVPKTIIKSTKSYPPTKEYESLVVFELDDKIEYSESQVIGEIKIKDSGLTVNCDYTTVNNIAIEKAKTLGANAIKIYEHKLPSLMGSSCHRIKAIALRIDDIWKYEKEIKWHKDRLLAVKDFKGSIENRPFQAATASYFRYRWYGTPISGVKLKVETLFDSHKSYFKLAEDSLFVLAHEQLHFDISELYARKFLKIIKEEVDSYQSLNVNHGKIYNQILSEYQAEQDKYDYEVYNDWNNWNKQLEWYTKIQKELSNYQEFINKEISISYFRQK